MGFTFKKFNELTDSFKQDVIEGVKIKHDVKEEVNLPDERRVHIAYLSTVQQKLSESNLGEEHKARIFTGAMILVREQIASTYSMRSADNSEVFKLLKPAIGLTKDNDMDSEALLTVLQETSNFIKPHMKAGDFLKEGLSGIEHAAIEQHKLLSSKLNALIFELSGKADKATFKSLQQSFNSSKASEKGMFSGKEDKKAEKEAADESKIAELN